jgi:hypothetical protein
MIIPESAIPEWTILSRIAMQRIENEQDISFIPKSSN